MTINAVRLSNVYIYITSTAINKVHPTFTIILLQFSLNVIFKRVHTDIDMNIANIPFVKG